MRLMGRPKTVYRGKRKYRWIITCIVLILLLLAAGAVWLFAYMQKFIVYDKDGLRLIPPFMAGEGDLQSAEGPETTSFVPLEGIEIVVDEPDYSDLDLVGDTQTQSIHARYISAEGMSADNIAYCGSQLPANGQDALVLQLKTSGGYLSYLSSVELTDAYGVNGTADIRGTVAALKEQDVYMVAEISCLLDDAMAVRNAPLALKNSAGGVLTDASGSWLDPYNESVRAYLKAIMEELADMGFDEILLSGVAHPVAKDIVFSQNMSITPSVEGSVSSFAVYMAKAARELNIKCSVMCTNTALRSGSSLEIGQDLELFFRIFDRVYVRTDMDHSTADISALKGASGTRGAECIVPVVSGYTPDTASWAAE